MHDTVPCGLRESFMHLLVLGKLDSETKVMKGEAVGTGDRCHKRVLEHVTDASTAKQGQRDAIDRWTTIDAAACLPSSPDSHHALSALPATLCFSYSSRHVLA